MAFCEKGPDGRPVWRFASHPIFPGWAADIKRCHAIMGQANVFVRQNPGELPVSVDELKQKLSNPATATEWMSKLSRYVANVPGTTPYWKQKRNQLKALGENLGEAHMYMYFAQ